MYSMGSIIFCVKLGIGMNSRSVVFTKRNMVHNNKLLLLPYCHTCMPGHIKVCTHMMREGIVGGSRCCEYCLLLFYYMVAIVKRFMPTMNPFLALRSFFFVIWLCVWDNMMIWWWWFFDNYYYAHTTSSSKIWTKEWDGTCLFILPSWWMHNFCGSI